MIRIGALLCILAVVVTGSPAFADTPALAPAPIMATVDATDLAHHTISLVAAGGAKLSADASVIDVALAKLAKGDRVAVTLDPATAQKDKTQKIVTLAMAASGSLRAGALILAFALVLLVATLATKGHPLEFLIGADRRYSNSKTQMAFWFATVMAAYLATIGLRVWLGGLGLIVEGVGIPTNLLVVTGLSGLTFAGAKAVTTQKVNSAVASGGTSPKQPAQNPDWTTDYFQNDLGETDIGDFQMLFITGIAIVIFVLSIVHYLTYVDLSPHTMLPDLDTTLLSGFGVGQGAYLIKKMASNPGEG